MNTPRSDGCLIKNINGEWIPHCIGQQLERELIAEQQKVKEMREIIAAYTVISTAFRAKDVGAPNSFERTKQEMHIKLEDQARAILEKNK